jgi:hypothetical protein
MTSEYVDEKGVVARLRERFADEALRTDEWLIERGWDQLDEAPHIWVEAFADRTTEAARAGNWNLVKEHSDFMAEEFRNGSEEIKQLVDVAYAENLMWDLDSRGKVLAWPHIAKEVRDLYERMWGVPKDKKDAP